MTENTCHAIATMRFLVAIIDSAMLGFLIWSFVKSGSPLVAFFMGAWVVKIGFDFIHHFTHGMDCNE